MSSTDEETVEVETHSRGSDDDPSSLPDIETLLDRTEEVLGSENEENDTNENETFPISTLARKSSGSGKTAQRLPEVQNEIISENEAVTETSASAKRRKSLAQDKQRIKEIKPVSGGTWGKKLSITTGDESESESVSGSATVKAWMPGHQLGSSHARRMAVRLTDLDREQLVNHVKSETEIRHQDSVAKDKVMIKNMKFVPSGKWGRKLSVSMTEADMKAKLAATTVSGLESARAKEVAGRLLQAENEIGNADATDPEPRRQHVKAIPDGQWGRKLSTKKEEPTSSIDGITVGQREFGSNQAKKMAARLVQVENEANGVDAEAMDPRAENFQKTPDGQWGRKLSTTSNKHFGSKRAQEMSARLLEIENEIISEVDAMIKDPRADDLKVIPDGQWGRRLSATPPGTLPAGTQQRKFGSKQAKKMTERLVQAGRDGWGKRLSVVNGSEDEGPATPDNAQNIESKQAKKMTERLVQSGKEGWGKRLSVVNDSEENNYAPDNVRPGAFGGRLSTAAPAASNLLGLEVDQLSLLREEEAAAIREEQDENHALDADSHFGLSDVGKLLREAGLDRFLDIFDDASITNIDEAVKLTFKDYKQLGIKKFSDKDTLRKLFIAATKKPTKMLISYAIESSNKKGTTFSKFLNNVRLNYGKLSVDTSTMTLDDALEAVENVDLVLVIMSDEYFSGPSVNLEARVATLVSALRNNVPVFTTYSIKPSTTSISHENKKLFSAMKRMLQQVDEGILASLAERGITSEDIFSAAERLSKTKAIPSSTLLLQLDKEIRNIKSN
mmetsp:Transcript_10151/g.13215  ORF Transcript_10151/g.13215 Transcript_10151/m.13215 type:complete len:787 (-) Transcript_10151:191-2551(-)|eukprot:CAMPEP_0204874186 /NCGR_PEP_ID=MMETSP1348-20121228/42632_1 /ASSEMBLY_ACC=CAM_ASM_000700 /TAXON_ID=215587 /ORGANISM="Aplanochytrium stocchinoi, Strain GSBS06" /LENGTH=786 /DNA_ID=CAMNT_0052029895 /DNA_START=122 /DNA_END=2482 /DNA_ORIENTATION=+